MARPDLDLLFTPGRIGGVTLRNRILMTPMGTNQEQTDGHLGEGILRYYEARARGGVGCVIAGVAAITWPEGACNPNQAAISDDRFLPDWEDLARRVHAHGAKLAVQLQHASKVAQEDVAAGRPLWVPSIPTPKMGDLMADLSPAELGKATAAYTGPTSKVAFREMSRADIAELTERFALAAARAQRAGADAVEVHAGHGYVLSSFLSPASNQREDEYGGDVEGRSRFLCEVLRATRERVGPDFAIWCRVDGREFHTEGGITEAMAQRTAELAEEAGADAIHVSAYADPTNAIAFTDAPLVHEPGGYLPLAEGVKKRVGIPVIAVGRITPTAGEEALRAGRADFIAMGRALLADPDLPRKLEAGKGETIRPCVYSYRCVGNVFLREASRCTVNPEMAREGELALRPTEAPRRVVVVGGGPVGLELARRAAHRGHDVTLLEREPELGGRARVAAKISEEMSAWLAWLVSDARRAGARIRTGAAAGPDEVRPLEPDALFVATGATRGGVLDLGTDAPPVLPAEALEQALSGAAGRWAVVGDDVIAVRAAEALSLAGHSVLLLGSGVQGAWAPQLGLPRRWRALHALRTHGAELVLEAGAVRADGGRVSFAAEGAVASREVDGILVAAGLCAAPDAADALAAAGLDPVRVGDCTGPTYLEAGLLAAARLAEAL